MKVGDLVTVVVWYRGSRHDASLFFSTVEYLGGNEGFYARAITNPAFGTALFQNDDEGVMWIRGHHARWTAEATALLAAHALTR